jgi:hypothetical protein
MSTSHGLHRKGLATFPLVLEYAEETVDTNTMQHIKDRAVKTLMNTTREEQ